MPSQEDQRHLRGLCTDFHNSPMEVTGVPPRIPHFLVQMALKKGSKKRENSDSERDTPTPTKKSTKGTIPTSSPQKWTEDEIKKLCDLRKAGMSWQ